MKQVDHSRLDYSKFNQYYKEPKSKFSGLKSKYHCAASTYGGLNQDSLLQYESKKGKRFMSMDLLKATNFKKEKVYINSIAYYTLEHPVVKGKRYRCRLNYYVGANFTNMICNGFGFLFIQDKGEINTYKYLQQTPQIYSSNYLKYDRNKWQTIEGEFIADQDYNHVLIGFFEPRNKFIMKSIRLFKFEKDVQYPKLQSLRINIDDIQIMEIKN